MPDEPQKHLTTFNHPKSVDTRKQAIPITQELVMAIADRVYKMLILEMKVERERQRFSSEYRRR